MLTSTIASEVDRINRIPGVAKMLEVICRTTGMGFAAIARVTDKQWLACAVRDEIDFKLKPGDELVLQTTLCNEIRQHQQPIVIDHFAESVQYADHHTPKLYGLQSYISVPIILKSGEFYGTLCAIDPGPAVLDNVKVKGMFELFSDLLSQHLGAMEELTETKAALSDERSIAELREQFIAILAHDIRTPISVVLNGSQLLLEHEMTSDMQQLAQLVERSAGRIRGLVDNMMDFASGKLGGGISIIREEVMLQPVFLQVVNEFQSLYPGREIRMNVTVDGTVLVDQRRVAQALSNLLGNALKYGRADKPVLVEGRRENELLFISVTNEGDAISPVIQSALFKPFVRGDVRAHQKGLGLGLYITSEIAKAHGGRVEVNSNDAATRFSIYL
ncbi:MAG: ATP-binding protein [Chitinophagaceae bacterium]